MPSRGQTIVITGASSGIGRAAANAFARRGARLVLAARRKDLLDDAVRDCQRYGGDAVAVEADVTDPEAINRIRDTALDRFGRIDVWINNAGVGAFGPYQSASLEVNRKTVETNLLGAMYGAYAVLPVFLKQGRGTLINNISMGGWAPAPFAAAYTASKFGLRGFTASLRQELVPHENIHVCAVFPAIIDTPGLNNLANVSGKALNPGPFYYTAEDVADTFVSLVENPRDEVAVGWPSRLAQIGYGLAPFIAEYLMGAVMRRALASADRGPNSDGAVLVRGPRNRGTSGGWISRKRMPPAGALTKAGVLGALALGAFAFMSLGSSPARTRGRR